MRATRPRGSDMRIGRKDAGEGPKDRPSADNAGGSPPIGSESAPAFDWSKVRGSGKQKGEKRKKEKLESPKADDAAPKIPKWVPNLTRNEQYIAGGVAVLVLAILYFAFLRGDPGLAPVLTTSQQQQMEQQAKKEMIDTYEAMEKKYGPENSEVQQQREMMRQLGVTPK